MSRILGILLCSFAFLSAYSQQGHFVYIQSDNKQGFYVRFNNKTYSSSASGYLILSKLKEGDLDITVGFPQNTNPEQHFLITVAKEDLGYNLKNLGDKGWGLFNLQTLSITYASAKDEKKNVVKKEEKADAFSDMLVQVTGDSSIKEAVSVKEAKPKSQVRTDTVSAKVVEKPKVIINVPDTVQIVKNADKPAVKDTVIKQQEFAAPVKEVIRKVTEFSNDETLSMIYLITKGAQSDTVNVIIEIDNLTSAKGMKQDSVERKPAVKFLDVKEDASIIKTDSAKSVNAVPVVKSTRINADCGGVASEDDFKKLRKKMASQANDDDMIYEARKAFRLKCYSTEQVKNLGSLFLTDAARYGFYDAAYPRVYDQEKFSELADQLKDEYYKNRFKAMLRG